MIKARTMSKTNTIVASDSSTSDDMGELEIAWVCCARERLKPHYHTFFCRQKQLEVNHRHSLCLCVWVDLMNSEWTAGYDLWFTEYDRGQQHMDAGLHKPPVTSCLSVENMNRTCGADLCWDKFILKVNVHFKLWSEDMKELGTVYF